MKFKLTKQVSRLHRSVESVAFSYRSSSVDILTICLFVCQFTSNEHVLCATDHLTEV